MKVLGLVGSPRERGNTDLLVEQLLEGARTKSYETEKLYRYDYTISLCSDCRSCKKAIMPVVCMMRCSRFIR
jgi:multimeric flavodoxin WrbA